MLKLKYFNDGFFIVKTIRVTTPVHFFLAPFTTWLVGAIEQQPYEQ
jgi:hypothetical protein